MNKAQMEGMVFTKEPYIEDVGPRKIASIQFDTFSESEISKLAEAQVFKGQYYDINKKPIDGGLLDPRLGPANKKLTCATCHGDYGTCPGHYGYLKLALPVLNVGYLSTIIVILKCVCKSCSRMLLDEKFCKEHLRRMRNLKEALKKAELMKKIVKKGTALTSNYRNVKCSRCGYVNGAIKRQSPFYIIHSRSKSNDGDKAESRSVSNNNLNAARVFSLFKRMLDEDCELLNLSDRPERLIITNVPVPPIFVRPSVIMDGGSQSNENDITERLKQIIQANASLPGIISTDHNVAWEMLQVEVAQYINSDIRGIPYNMQVSKPLAGFVQRLKGKQGRFRGNLSGKRVEFTGRTVISPDPNLKITEVAIPIHMAKILTYPERVTPHNIEKLRQCVSNGPDKYPGARNIRHHDGSTRNLNISARKRLADELQYGETVERHLEDGDIVLFNRQPSLHRMSIISHRIRVMPWRTLRFNESVCNPYNADFDGDEMNLHCPQTEEARTEAILLMGVQNNLCTPKNGENLVASTQDFLTSSFLITRKDTFYDRAAFSHMCSYMGDGMDMIDLPTPSIIKPIELWTGKQLFSILVRPHANVKVYLNLTVKEKIYSKPQDGKEKEAMCPNDGFVYFRNSELISGQVGKTTLGNGNKDGLFSILLRDYKAHAAASCMNRLAKLSARWIGNHGFSIGIDDVQPGKYLNEQKQKTILKGYQNCDNLIHMYNKGSLPPEAGCDAAQSLEAKISKNLNDIREATGNVCMQNLHWRNSPLIMSQCGSKGSPINISQMVACVGQQSVGGRRAPDGFIDRSLPHFPRKTKTPAAKGFVANSFYSGLTATEFFFHTMGGREGLVDTAVKTADTGYMSRRLIKGLEDLSIRYDNTVRNAGGCIIQFCYGDDGMDPAAMEGKSGTPLNFDRLFLKAKASAPARGIEVLSPVEVAEAVEQRFPENDTTLKEGSEAFVGTLKSFLKKYIEALRNTWDMFVVENQSDSCKKTVENIDGDDNLEVQKKIAQNIHGVTRRQLKVFLDTCMLRYYSKKIEPGTAIGAIGAQSIGEPGTQMTLRTFHFAGVASMNITLGVPRIKEIINGAKKISTPIITAALVDDQHINKARIIAESIKSLRGARSAVIRIKLDLKRIRDAELHIDANDVKESILQSPRIKLKQEHINVLDARKLQVFPPEADRDKLCFQLNSLKNLLPKVIVKGVRTVERAVIKEEKDSNMKKKFSLLVEGMGLQAVMGIEGVDGRNTTSNHVIEVQQTLGIEAARKCIINEIKYTMESHGMNIDIRHMMLLADLMTYRGEVLGITRFGIQRMDKSVLMLASFEKTADHLFNASVSGRDNKIEGVSECIIMGIPMQIGTGMLKVRQRAAPAELRYGPEAILA